MELASLKPLLTTLVLPPAGPLLLCLLGLILWKLTRKTKLGAACTFVGLLLAWLLSCQAVAVTLNGWLLKSYPVAAAPSSLSTSSNPLKAQAVVVLGSGLQTHAPEYGDTAQLSKWAAARLRYGAWYAQEAALPLAFSGGRGWAADSKSALTEADGASNYLVAPAKPS
jgi:uncharacterized SAM-binding protein YcdF (DUF218 family)